MGGYRLFQAFREWISVQPAATPRRSGNPTKTTVATRKAAAVPGFRGFPPRPSRSFGDQHTKDRRDHPPASDQAPQICFGSCSLKIGAPGFEPGTSATQRPRATRLRHAPLSHLEPVGSDAGGPQALGSRPMADVRPIHATHYDLGVVGSLQDVAAPPYDVIDAACGRSCFERSPYNAVAIDLPKPYGETGPQQTDDDPYERAARADGRMARGRRAGRRLRARDLGDDPGLRRPRRHATHPSRHPRPRPGRGLLRRPGPAARAHPAGAEERPARPHARHPPQPLADLLAQHQGSLAAGRPGDRVGRRPGAKRPTKAAR